MSSAVHPIAASSTLMRKLSAYVQLTKPGILRLLVLTTICTMIVAQRGMPDLGLLMWTLIGTTFVCGSANALNMVWDQDIDAVMNRTMHRPLVTGELTTIEALSFASALGLAGVVILNFMTTPLAALMGIAGHAFYVIIYTMLLKRRTPQNIVIGGAAGAFPPLIGWAAVTGEAPLVAWLIFALIFLWTPPHFWALALYKDVEYGKANVPMMPVVRGHYVTKLLMLFYTLLMNLCALLIGLVGALGIVYLVASTVLGAVFAYFVIRTAFVSPEQSTPWAKKTFAYSILYLALIFGAMSFDSAYTQHFSSYSYLTSLEQEAKLLRAAEGRADQLRFHNALAPISAPTPAP
jgi:protoheme IX farnesyltransferase